MSKSSDGPLISSDDRLLLQSLTPGSSVELQITTPTAPKRIRTVYVGMDIPNGVIFQLPNSIKWTLMRDMLYPGNTIVVRFVVEGEHGQVIAFRTEISKVMTSPISLIFVTFPTSIQTQGLRAEKRSIPGIPVTVSTSDIAHNVKALVIDISRTGCRMILVGEAIMEINSQVTMLCKVDAETITLAGLIKNLSEENGQTFCGIQFTSKQSTVAKVIDRYMILV